VHCADCRMSPRIRPNVSLAGSKHLGFLSVCWAVCENLFLRVDATEDPMQVGEIMHTSVKPCTLCLAVAGAGILTLGLVTPPVGVDAAVSHGEIRAVQLAAVNASMTSNDAIATADALTRAVTRYSLPSAAAATSASTIQVNQLAANPIATITTALQIIASRTAGIAADLTLGVAAFAVVAPLWWLASPLTFPLTLFATALSTPDVNYCLQNCFTIAAENWLAFPLIIPATVFTQAYQQAQALVQNLLGLFKPAATTASTDPLTHSTAAVADPQSQADATTPVEANPNVTAEAASAEPVRAHHTRLAHRAAALADAVTIPAAKGLHAVDPGLTPAAAALSDADTTPTANPTPKAVSAGKHRKAGAHRADARTSSNATR
jgi:hypothetical protein